MSAYITATGSFLPGSPVPNEEIEDYIGEAGRSTSDLQGNYARELRHQDASLRDRQKLARRSIRTHSWQPMPFVSRWNAQASNQTMSNYFVQLPRSPT